ncbi:DUF3127 domain-containing protein [Xylanibacter ruminicola]|uniref:DUF3127 domain-containing protein n=1 Tax=Xylanibacter ruminicola TaxID=839 RepID=A0A1M6Z9U6_XYLRU|nr:DUF3127 domain-containing protein [Xylanibacter ruminicola]SHL27217.1 protein of unknown function [Xylanibacter ruminicola]
MSTLILRVKKCGAMTTVQSEKSEGGVLNKRTLVLQELGGKYANCYVVTLLGNQATIEFEVEQLVACDMRFQAREFQGQNYMDIVANEIVKL